MTAKKKAKPKSKPKSTMKTGYFVVTQSFEKKVSDWQEQHEDAEITGPLTEEVALDTIEKKISDGCERSKITVISGRRLAVEVKLK